MTSRQARVWVGVTALVTLVVAGAAWARGISWALLGGAATTPASSRPAAARLMMRVRDVRMLITGNTLRKGMMIRQTLPIGDRHQCDLGHTGERLSMYRIAFTLTGGGVV